MSVEEELRRRLAELEAQLGESRDVLNAIYNREVDALVVRGPGGEQVFTLEGADHLLVGERQAPAWTAGTIASWIRFVLGASSDDGVAGAM